MEFSLPLIEREIVAENTARFAFDISGQDFPYKAGQHADFTLTNPPYTDEGGNTRIFSFITSPDNKERIEITTRLQGSAFKRSLMEVPLQTPVRVTGIRGRMTLHADTTKPAVFLIGGIGVTPFMSMLQWATEEKFAQHIYVLYSNRTVASTAYLREIAALSQQNPYIHFTPTFTDEESEEQGYEVGPITLEMIKKYVPEFENAVFYTAGPPSMVNAMLGLLEKAGVAEERIKSEDFSGYE